MVRKRLDRAIGAISPNAGNSPSLKNDRVCVRIRVSGVEAPMRIMRITGMLSLIGLLTIFSVVALLLSGRVSPVIGLTIPPFIGAIAAGFGAGEIANFFTAGLAKVSPVASMFIFAILFFGTMQDAGLFRPLIDGLIRITRGNVIAVAIGTGAAGMLAHLDGAGATTFLLTIPALLPLYHRLGMNPYLMLLLLAIGAGVFNMMPWAGPLGRAAAVIGEDVAALWRPLIAVQGAGAFFLLLFAGFLGFRESRRIAKAGPHAECGTGAFNIPADNTPEQSGGKLRFALNAAILFLVLASLIAAMLPAAYIFLIGLSVALLVNYSNARAQMAAISAHAPSAITMAAIIFAAGSFLGVLDESGMLAAIAKDIAIVLPREIAPYLHLIVGAAGVPLELVLSTDAYYFGLLPIITEIVAPYDVTPQAAAYALLVGSIVGTFLSPFSPALWLALGLSGLDMGRHIRFSLAPMWAFSLGLMLIALALGLFR